MFRTLRETFRAPLGDQIYPWLPFVYEFNGPDGALGLPWVNVGGWAISSNQGVCTPTFTGEKSVDGGLENWTTSTNLTSWTESLAGSSTVNREGTIKNGGAYSCRLAIDSSNNAASIRQNIVNSVGDWLQFSFYAYSATAGKTLSVNIDGGGTSILVNPDPGPSWTQYFWTPHANNANTAITFTRGSAASTNIYFDDISVQAFTAGIHSAYISQGVSDLNISITPTIGVTRTRCGVWLAVDNPAAPANGLLAWCDGANARLDQLLAGAWSNLKTGAVSYAAGRTLMVKKSGSTVKLYYNGTQVSTNATCDTSLVGNTYCGILSTNANNRPGTFTISRYV